MATTARRSNRYPTLSDIPDGPAGIGNLAADVDDVPSYNRGTTAARPLSGRFLGDIYWCTDDFTMSPQGSPTVWNSASWQYWSPPANPANATPGSRTLGYGAGAALPGNDATVTNARTPISHAASHRQGGSDKIGGVVPLGGMIDYWGSTDPADTDWLMPDGRALNSVADTTLAPLYALISTAHGGTGPNNFFLPNVSGRMTMMKGTASPAVNGGTAHTVGQKGGEETHVLTAPEVANHIHYVPWQFAENGGGGNFVAAMMSRDQTPLTAMGYGMRYRGASAGGAIVSGIGRLNSSASAHDGATGFGGDPFTDLISFYDVASLGAEASGPAAAAHNTLPPYMGTNKLMRVR